MRHDKAAEDKKKINGEVCPTEGRNEIEQARLGQEKKSNGTPSPQ
jgi:hypothetical protein